MRDRVQFGLMLAPYLTGLVALVIVPAIAGFGLAFADYNALQPPRFAGLSNFRALVSDDVFHIAVANSLFYIALAVPLRLVGALLTARLLFRPTRGARLYRALVYLPTVIPDMAWALIWLWILNPIYGPLNQSLALIGIDGPAWLVDPTWARLGIVLMMIWQIGEGFIVCLASLQGVSRDLLDQAAVDGSGPWRAFWGISLPLLRRRCFCSSFGTPSSASRPTSSRPSSWEEGAVLTTRPPSFRCTSTRPLSGTCGSATPRP